MIQHSVFIFTLWVKETSFKLSTDRLQFWDHPCMMDRL